MLDLLEANILMDIGDMSLDNLIAWAKEKKDLYEKDYEKVSIQVIYYPEDVEVNLVGEVKDDDNFFEGERIWKGI